MVGPEFEAAPEAVMLPLNSSLRKKIDRALLTLRETGPYEALRDKWFGTP
jgi:ABC-type amino acid transport substrate-binding protein